MSDDSVGVEAYYHEVDFDGNQQEGKMVSVMVDVDWMKQILCFS